MKTWMINAKSTTPIIVLSLIAMLILSLLNLNLMTDVARKHWHAYVTLGCILPALTQIWCNLSNFVSMYLVPLVLLFAVGFLACTILPLLMKNKAALARVYAGIAVSLAVFLFLSYSIIKMPLIKIKLGIGARLTDAEVKQVEDILKESLK